MLVNLERTQDIADLYLRRAGFRVKKAMLKFNFSEYKNFGPNSVQGAFRKQSSFLCFF